MTVNRICMRCGCELGTGDLGGYCASCKDLRVHTLCEKFTSSLLSLEKGWLCPRCGAINSPKLNQCVCTTRATNS